MPVIGSVESMPQRNFLRPAFKAIVETLKTFNLLPISNTLPSIFEVVKICRSLVDWNNGFYT